MKRISDFDIVQDLERKLFDERHPKEALPSWLPNCMVLSAGRDRETRIWNVKRLLSLKSNRQPFLTKVNPVTGEKLVVMDDTPGEYDLIFEVEVDLSDRSVVVLTDIDFGILQEANYQKY